MRKVRAKNTFSPYYLLLPPISIPSIWPSPALSFLGEQGPSGLSLRLLRPKFEQHLSLLADYSLQLGILITPTVIPLAESNFKSYEAAINRWWHLQDKLQKRRIIEQDKMTSLTIQRDLLQYAEESCYPADIHLLRMLERSQKLSEDQPWQAVWQDYLRTQMNAGTTSNTSTDLSYQTCALLWTTLFSTPQDQRALADVIQEHWADSTKPQRQAQRFLLSLLRNLRNLFNILFSNNIAINAENRLKHCSASEQTELLTILFGRILQIQEEDEDGSKTEPEVQRIVQLVLPFAQTTSETSEVVLDIIHYLPMRTRQEVIYLLDFADNTQEKDLQAAAVLAIRYARPTTDEVWTELGQGRKSRVFEVREAVKETLRRKSK